MRVSVDMLGQSIAVGTLDMDSVELGFLSAKTDFVETSLVPAELTHKQSGLDIEWLAGAPKAPELTATRRLSLATKRAMDIAGALVGLLILAPLFLIVAALIKVTDHGPVFFSQGRTGFGGATFKALKFRSMYVHSGDPTGVAQTVKGDTRVTPIGAFIRKTSIDELPQLINVLRGDMSLVGPRPHVPGMIAAGKRYEDLVPYYDFRHSMRPGITGWAQCKGLRGPTSERHAAIGRIGHDFAYVQNFSILLDLRILTETIMSEIFSGNAH